MVAVVRAGSGRTRQRTWSPFLGTNKMACSLADDLRQFPDACDAIRVGSECWQAHHSTILRALVSGAQAFLRGRTRLPLDQLLDEYRRAEPSVTVDGVEIRLMYGSPPLFLAGTELQMDIKGLVHLKPEPLAQSGSPDGLLH